MAGGKLRCMLNTSGDQANFVTVTPVCCRVPSFKRSELFGEEAVDFLRNYLFRNVEIQFVGGLEKHTNIYYAVITCNKQNINKELLE